MPDKKPSTARCPRGHKAIMRSPKSGKCDVCEREDALKCDVCEREDALKQPVALRAVK